MQGTIVKVAVEEGATVEEGDVIVVLEAMKMEQPLKAHKAGTVSGLKAEVGSGVTNGEVICEITDADNRRAPAGDGRARRGTRSELASRRRVARHAYVGHPTDSRRTPLIQRGPPASRAVGSRRERPAPPTSPELAQRTTPRCRCWCYGTPLIT